MNIFWDELDQAGSADEAYKSDFDKRTVKNFPTFPKKRLV